MTQDWSRLLDAVAGPDPVQAGFGVCADIARREVGCPVLTATLQDEATGSVERVFSGRPDAWAVGGRKALSVGAWSDTVIGRREPFVANSFAEMAAVFSDHAVSEGLGLGSIVNVPIIVGDRVIGTANVLNVPGFYDRERIERAMSLRPFFTLAMLAAI